MFVELVVEDPMKANSYVERLWQKGLHARIETHGYAAGRSNPAVLFSEELDAMLMVCGDDCVVHGSAMVTAWCRSRALRVSWCFFHSWGSMPQILREAMSQCWMHTLQLQLMESLDGASLLFVFTPVWVCLASSCSRFALLF